MPETQVHRQQVSETYNEDLLSKLNLQRRSAHLDPGTTEPAIEI